MILISTYPNRKIKFIMYRRETAKKNIAQHVHRQLPEVLFLNYKDPKLCDSAQFISYRQAINWIREKEYCLRKFINMLKLYPSLIQENACEPFWNFIQPLLPTSVGDSCSSPIPNGNLTTGFSPTPPPGFRLRTPHDQSSITTVKSTTEASSNTLSDRKKEYSPARKLSLVQQPTLNQSRSPHGKGIINIPSIFISNESSMKESANNGPGSNVYNGKVFLCKDPADIEDSMSMAVLSSLSSVSFVHCLPPTVEPVQSLIPECDAFVFIMNNFTISAANCLSQLQQAQSLHLPIQFIRSHDFQLPQNLKEIVKISLASATDLHQYLSIRRRSYVTLSASSIRSSCCSSDREASPERSGSSPFYRDQHKNLLPCLPSPSRHSEDRNGDSADRIVSTIVSCLQDGYQKAQLYDLNCHILCVSQIIDSVSKLLESPLSYNTAYFQLKKKRQAKSARYQHSVHSRPFSNVSFQRSPEANKQTGSQYLKSKKQVPQTPSPNLKSSNRKDHNDINNLISVIPAHRSKSKTLRRHRQVLFDKASSKISPDSSDSHSSTDPSSIITLKIKPFNDSDNDHDDDDDDDDGDDDENDDDDDEEEGEQRGLEYPQLLDSSSNKCLSEEKETAYVIYPDGHSAFNNKPMVIKWPMPWNQMEKETKKTDSLRDETDSTSTNFFDLDLTTTLHTFSDDD